ncbi:MAG: aminotransferase class IV [Sandaracinus sp.]
MGTIAVIDGSLRSEERASISVFDRGFLFGDSVFEVLRTYGGRPFELGAHLDRLARSARGMGIELPIDARRFAREVERGLAKAANTESYVRIVLTRGRGPLHIDPRTAHKPARVILVSPLLTQSPELYAHGVGLTTVRFGRSTDRTRAEGAKVSAYVANMLAFWHAREHGGHEALMVADDGHVSEGNSSNVFVVRKGEILTPPLSLGILPGITRGIVERLARELDVPFREAMLVARDFETADEAFLTSSLREVVPVVSIDGRRIGDGLPGPRTLQLLEAYRARTRELTSFG